ncbi:MAG: hypothetical protein J1F05_08670 [Muribaculaceae bacterium]|nr:hypothetical protein [Muribaculaceae bacterium]
MKFSLRHYLVENKRKVFCVAIALLVIFLASWLLNYLAPEYKDDFKYKFILVKGMSHQKVSSIQDVLLSQYTHYFTTNGRTLVHIVVQLFCGIWGKTAFNVVNAGVFVLFITLLTKFAGRVTALNITFICALIILFFPAFAETMLWMAGSINYLWTFVAVCFVLLSVPSLQRRKVHRIDWLLFIPGVMVGWSHEGISFPLALSLGVYMLVYRKKISKSALLPLAIGISVGAIMCLSSPGIIYRGLNPNKEVPVSMVERLLNGWEVISQAGFVYILAFGVFVKLIIERHNAWHWLKKAYLDNIIPVNALVLSVAVVFGCGRYNARVASGVDLFSLLIILSFIKKYPRLAIKPIKYLAIALALVAYCGIVKYSYQNYINVEDVKMQLEAHNSSIIHYNEVSLGNRLKPYVLKTFNAEIISSKNKWNKRISNLYGYESLVFIPKNVYSDIINNKLIEELDRQRVYGLNIVPLSADEIDKTPYHLYDFGDNTVSRPIEEERYEVLFLNNQWWLLTKRQKYRGIYPSQIIMK